VSESRRIPQNTAEHCRNTTGFHNILQDTVEKEINGFNNLKSLVSMMTHTILVSIALHTMHGRRCLQKEALPCSQDSWPTEANDNLKQQ